MVALMVLVGVIMAGAEAYSGECGANVTWTLDVETGELSIEGTGAIFSYYPKDAYEVHFQYSEEDIEANGGRAPWNKYADHIRKVNIGEGITYVGYGCFY
jgi:hypothetical protein